MRRRNEQREVEGTKIRRNEQTKKQREVVGPKSRRNEQRNCKEQRGGGRNKGRWKDGPKGCGRNKD